MKLEFIYKLIPIPVFYTDRFVILSGKSFGMFICIKPEFKDNIALLEHELVHCRQFYRTLCIHSILYKLSSKYRLNSEIEAYKATIEYSGYTEEIQSKWIVNSLLNDYDLDYTREYIEGLLYD